MDYRHGMSVHKPYDTTSFRHAPSYSSNYTSAAASSLDRLSIREHASPKSYSSYRTSNSYGSHYPKPLSTSKTNLSKDQHDILVDPYSYRARSNYNSATPSSIPKSTSSYDVESSSQYRRPKYTTDIESNGTSSLYDDLGRKSTKHTFTSTLSSTSSPKYAHRNRDHELSVNSLESLDDEETGNVGLENLGNTCFMNSAMQCLLNTKALINFMKGRKVDEDRITSKGKGELIAAYKDVVSQVWGTRPPRTLAPENLKIAVQRFAPRFSGYLQQDCQEFLRYLLLGLHEDLNKVTSKPKYIESDDKAEQHMSLEEKSSLYWEKYLNFDNSAVVDIFVGQLKSTLECQRCGYESVTFDPFWDLSLPIPKYMSEVSLKDCLTSFTKKETLEEDERPTCEKCKTRQNMTKSFLIQKFPKVLVLHLKRFSGERYKSKLSTLVNFDIRNLDLSFFAASKGTKAMYNLYGVCNHVGNVYSGHYTAFCKHPYKHKWYQFDDSRVRPCSQDCIVSDEAYVLFYELSE